MNVFKIKQSAIIASNASEQQIVKTLSLNCVTRHRLVLSA